VICVAVSARPTTLPPRALIGGCLGNAAEWYDFAVYGAFATVLAATFFPTGGRAALAATFAIFAMSFFARPIGATIVGRWSDRFGRRPLLSRTIAVMSFATAGIGLLPTWSMVGAAAPVALLLLRLAQGFSAGGEVASSVPFLLESAPERQRGWYGGWHLASITLGMAGGYGAATLLSVVLGRAALLEWGWRLAFLVAVPLGVTARHIRRRLTETSLFEAVRGPSAPRLIRDVLRGRGARAGRGFVLVAAVSVTFNVWFVFLPSYLVASGTVSLTQTLGICAAGLLTAAAIAPMMGRLSDLIGRRTVLVAGTAAVAAFAVPGFTLARASALGLLASDVVMGGLIGALAVTAFIGELFPTAVRATGVALTYGVASAVFGGTAPLVATLMVTRDVAWVIPAQVTAFAALATVAVAAAAETAFDPLS